MLIEPSCAGRLARAGANFHQKITRRRNEDERIARQHNYEYNHY